MQQIVLCDSELEPAFGSESTVSINYELGATLRLTLQNSS